MLEHWQTLNAKIKKLLSRPTCLVRHLMSLICRLHIRPIQWHLKNSWRVPETLEKVITILRSLSSKVVAGGRQYASKSTITSTKACSTNLQRPIKRRVECSLGGTHCKGNLFPSRKQTAHKLSETKGGLSGPKEVPRPLLEPNSAHSYRQHHSGCLHKQGGGMKSGPLCGLL